MGKDKARQPSKEQRFWDLLNSKDAQAETKKRELLRNIQEAFPSRMEALKHFRAMGGVLTAVEYAVLEYIMESDAPWGEIHYPH